MIDIVKKKPIRVSASEGQPYLVVPLEQLDKVTALLDANQVAHWVDEEVLSIDGKPEIAFINLDDQTDAAMVQRLLDTVP